MDKHKYQIPTIPYVVVITLVTSPLLIFGIMFPDMFWLWVMFTLPYIIYSLYMGVMEVGTDGVKLYRVNMLEWKNVKSARIRNLLGLRYLFVKRQKGMNYWIPLYFKGDTPVDVAFRENAPADNPISSCF